MTPLVEYDAEELELLAATLLRSAQRWDARSSRHRAAGREAHAQRAARVARKFRAMARRAMQVGIAAPSIDHRSPPRSTT